MSQQAEEETVPTVCESHTKTKAEWYCKKYMCEECKKTHNDGHTIVSVLDLFDGKCPEHPERYLDFVCNDCNGIILPIFMLSLFVCYLLLA